ncbi:hypothetical protein GMB70_10820 [Turicibacter sanguinis]|nr:hypothetical protein [Turicibacter sanguinis]
MELVFFNSLESGKIIINYEELITVITIFFILTIIAVFIKNRNLFHKILIWMGLSSHTGYPNIWSEMFCKQEITEWIFIRDYQREELILGLPQNISLELNPAELLLTNVEVYDFQGNIKYEVGTKYIIFNPEIMAIGFSEKI